MSDRDLDPRKKRFEAWMKGVEDRLTTLETRKLTGAISIDSLDAGATAVSATRTDPLVLKGSAAWTQGVEYLGTPGAPLTTISGDHALVTRNANGTIQDITPAPFVQLEGGAVQSIASTTVVPITLVGATPFSSPYAAAATIAANGQFIIPATGIYEIYSQGAWPNVVGTKGRVVIVQCSPDGGVSWLTLFADGRQGINTAVLGQDVAVMGRCPLPKGYRLRIAVVQDEVGALNYTPARFSFAWVCGYNL